MIKKWLSGLLSEPATQQPETSETVFEGHTIYACARQEQGQFRVAGTIRKGEQEVDFIRSDLCPDAATANDLMQQKAKLFIQQLGDDIFKQ